jgi:predicted metal-binding protein
LSFTLVKYVFRPEVRDLCAKPYPGHPFGCPNFEKKRGCPPMAPLFPEVFIDLPVYAIYNRFDLGSHATRLKKVHPGWSWRQLTCCLYWQGTARKILKKEIEVFRKQHPDMVITTCPEAMGVDVTATMASIGVLLEWPPKKWTYQVALAAYRKF